MKRSKFSDEQILAIVKEGEAGRKVSDLCRTHGIAGPSDGARFSITALSDTP